MFTVILIALLLTILSILFYKWATKNNDFFKKQNIAFQKPTFLLGSIGEVIFNKISIPELIENSYRMFPDEKIIGAFNFREPIFIIRDLELIKMFCVKEFDSFSGHISTVNEDLDPLLGNTLVSLQGKKWKNMRATLSPAFTGSKMRQMFELVEQCVDTTINSLKLDISNNALDMKELFSKFTISIIASCAFGLEIDTYKHPDNDFKKIADKVVNPKLPVLFLKATLCNFFPKIMKKLDISLLDQHTKSFFRQTINGTMQYREWNNIVRPDMIHLLMQAKKGNLKFENENSDANNEETHQWTDDEIVAQCLIFFLAGFDTSSSALSFAAYELAINPDVQTRLRDEINGHMSDKKLSYDEVNKIKYLDRFTMEVLRKWPPAVATERICSKEFKFEVDGKEITIPEKKGIQIPIIALQHDPKYFPNPEKFDPDRFDDENISSQNLNALNMFGLGPRSCIGNRFALMNLKLVLLKMVTTFFFEVSEKTQIPLKYKKSMATVTTENGVWIKLRTL